MSNARNIARLLPNTSGQLPVGNLQDASITPAKITQLGKTNMPAGSVLQVQQVQFTTKLIFSATSSGGYNFTEVSQFRVSITPTSATSKILVHAHVHGVSTGSTAGINLVRSINGGAYSSIVHGTELTASTAQRGIWMGTMYTFNDTNQSRSFGAQYLDSPNTTQPITYSLGFNNDSGSNIYINMSINNSAGITGTCSTSSLILMEIAA